MLLLSVLRTSRYPYATAMDHIDIDYEGMFPGLENHGIRYALYVRGMSDTQAQTQLIEFEGIEEVDQLAIYDN